MTGYKSKRDAALDEEGMYLVHHTQSAQVKVEGPLHVVCQCDKCKAQPEQEPVAYWNFNSGFSHCMIDQLNEAAKKNPAPLYTAPPQREPLTIEYQSGYYDGKKAALAGLEQNFCPRCGKRTKDIHTCTPPQEKNSA